MQLKNFSSKSDKGRHDKEEIDDVLGKYSGMNEDELIEELMKSVARSKADGTYNADQMKNFVNLVAPHIGDEQRQKLNNIIQILNNQ